MGLIAFGAAGVLAANEMGLMEWPDILSDFNLWPAVAIAATIGLFMFSATVGGGVGGLFMIGTLALGGAAVLSARQIGLTDWPEFTASANLWPAIGILSGVALLFYAMAVSVVGRQRRLRRVEDALSAPHVRVSTTPAVAGVSEERDTGGRDVPAFHYEIIKARKLPKTDAKLRRITAEANVVGRPPIRILHLWVFDNPTRLSNYLNGAWREFGYVHLLRSARSVTRKELAAADHFGGIDSLIADTTDEVDVAIGDFVYAPDQKRRKRFKTEVERGTSTWDRYGGYSVNSLLCHDDVWRYALGRLLSSVDVVTMDISGYTPQNHGSEYEIQTLIDQIPIDKVVWLTDPWTDVPYLTDQLRGAWNRLASRSPNRMGSPGPVRLVETDYISESSSTSDDSRPSSTTLESSRRDARRIATNLFSL